MWLWFWLLASSYNKHPQCLIFIETESEVEQLYFMLVFNANKSKDLEGNSGISLIW